MTYFNSVANPEMVFFSLLAGTTIFLAFSLFNSFQDDSSNNGLDNQNTDLGSSSDISSDVSTQTISGSVNTQTTVSPISDPNIVTMPNLENQILSLHEIKAHEFMDLYSDKIAYYKLTYAEILGVVRVFDVTELQLANINQMIHDIL